MLLLGVLSMILSFHSVGARVPADVASATVVHAKFGQFAVVENATLVNNEEH
jgi:hypothetical protein